MKHKILMTLVLLMTAATGAWADGETATITLKCGTTEKTYENVTLPWSTTADILKAVVTGLDFNVNINAISGGDGKVVKNGNENFTVTGTFSGDATVTVTYNMGSSATITVTAPRPLMTLSDDGKTATMESMPAFDATVNYEIVRDLATSTKVDLIIGTGSDAVTATADTRLRIQKDNTYGYLPVSALSCNFVDQIEGNTILPTGFDDAKLTPQFYLQGEDDTWNLVTDINTTTKLPNNLQPGQVYCITLKAADGSYYDGETPQSFTVTLFEGYEVKVPAGEYVTFYKDEPLYADPVSSADAKLYTISSVSTIDGTATLSDAIATAPSSTPLLVYNAGNTDATFLLIPADAEPNLALTVAPEFIGTTEATTIPASTDGLNNYAFNGKKFVWVMNALEIGANKAWLSISATSGARVINLVFDDATRIDGVTRTAEQSGDYYDLNGRKLAAKPTRKGVYIQNGKKVVVK